jgi:hypothetical protein
MRAIGLMIFIVIAAGGVGVMKAFSPDLAQANERRRIEKDCPIGTWITDGTIGAKPTYVCQSATMAIPRSPDAKRFVDMTDEERGPDPRSMFSQNSELDSDLAPVDAFTAAQSEADAQKKTKVQDPLTFGGYACKVDCSGHRAGYAWAQRRDVRSRDGCTGKSKSFIEGCFVSVDTLSVQTPRS